MANPKNQSAQTPAADTFKGNGVKPLTKNGPKNSGDATPRKQQ